MAKKKFKKSSKTKPIKSKDLAAKLKKKAPRMSKRLDKVEDQPVVVCVPGYAHTEITDVFEDKGRLVLTAFPASRDTRLLEASREVRKDFHKGGEGRSVAEPLISLFKAIEYYDGRDPTK